jgi:DNA polymerase III delta subunit
VDAIVDSVNSVSFGGGIQLVLVRDAHLLKNLEKLAELFGPSQHHLKMASVCVCISKDLDGRKKFSKLLVEKAAVVACEDVAEGQKTAWIQYLAKQRSVQLSASMIMQLSSLDPWSLDIVDQELEKFLVAGQLDAVILQQNTTWGSLGGSDGFLSVFFTRNLKEALSHLVTFTGSSDDALPLLGLLSWNSRQLALLLLDRVQGTKSAKINSYWVERLNHWSRQWSLSEVIELQRELAEMDFKLKQTAHHPLGIWTDLITRFAKK